MTSLKKLGQRLLAARKAQMENYAGKLQLAQRDEGHKLVCSGFVVFVV